MFGLTQKAARDGFLFWWPVTARVLGVAGAFVEAGYAIVSHQAADAAVLGFCGALILVPVVFDTQDKRNRKRSGGEE